MPVSDLGGERVDYVGDQLLESAVPAEPYALFRRWLDEAFAARDRGELAEPTAMVVATCVDGRPRARTVLLKELTPDGFTFFTNYTSPKGVELSADPAVALHFGWHPMQRQVRVEGTRGEGAPGGVGGVLRHPAPRLAARRVGLGPVVVGRLPGELKDAYAAAEERFAGRDVPCPEHWGGYLVRPVEIEFWQGQPSRMHDRLRLPAGRRRLDDHPPRAVTARSQASSLRVISTARNRRTKSSSTVRVGSPIARKRGWTSGPGRQAARRLSTAATAGGRRR